MAAGKRAPSKHSRASRRATSPSINTDKSLKSVSLPRAHDDQRTTTTQPSVLAARHAAGVTKRTNKAGRKSRPSAKAKRRHEKGLEMAEAVLERTGQKIEKSAGRARAVRARRKAWDDINKIVGEDNGEADADVTAAAAKKRGQDGLAEESEDGTDEEMDGDEMAESEELALKNDQAVDDDVDEEIL